MNKVLNRKGYILVETLVTAVVLITTLVMLYSSYSGVVNTEKQRLFYDDIASIYKTQSIKDILDVTLNYAKFNQEIVKNRNTNNRYIYFFNVNSPIYIDNTLITNAKNIYNFYQLAYINFTDISNIKKCLKGQATEAERTRCNNTKTFVSAYEKFHLKDYLLTLDVPISGDEDFVSGYSGILISMIYEAKNGDKAVREGSYQNCLNGKVLARYGGSLKKAMHRYDNDSNIDYDMYCENAYYVSWVYL